MNACKEELVQRSETAALFLSMKYDNQGFMNCQTIKTFLLKH